MLTLSKTSSLARLLILNDCAVLDWLCLSSACIVEVRERVKLRCTHDGHMYGKGDRGQGQQVYFLLRSIKYSSQGRDSILCCGLRSLFFGMILGTVRYFSHQKGQDKTIH